MLAKASKWQIGAGGVEWLGLRISSGLGLAWVPQPKALKAIGEIQSVLDGTCKAGDYRKLIGLLRRTQPRGFEVLVQPDTGASSDALNCRAARRTVTPADLLRESQRVKRPRRIQPFARLAAAADDAEPAPDEPDEEDDGADAAARPRAIQHVRCGRDGELRLL